MEAKEYAGEIAKLLQDKNPDIRGRAAVTLSDLGAKDYSDNIAKLLDDKEKGEHGSDIRGLVIEALVKLEAKQYEKDIVKLLSDPETRRTAVNALRDLDAKESAKDVAKLINDEDFYTRIYAIEALGKWKAKEYKEDLAKLLDDGNIEIRNYAKKSLEEMGEKEFLESKLGKLREAKKGMELSENEKKEMKNILAKLTDDSNKLLLGATYSLSHTANPKYIKDVEKIFNAIQSYGQGDESVITKLGGVKGFKDQVAKLLENKDGTVRGYGAILLGTIGDKEYAKRIAILLDEKESKESDTEEDKDYFKGSDCGMAAIALGILKATEYAKNLDQLLKSKNEYIRSGAALGLGYMGAKEAIPDIKKLLNDENANVRSSAEFALSQLGVSEEEIEKLKERR